MAWERRNLLRYSRTTQRKTRFSFNPVPEHFNLPYHLRNRKTTFQHPQFAKMRFATVTIGILGLVSTVASAVIEDRFVAISLLDWIITNLSSLRNARCDAILRSRCIEGRSLDEVSQLMGLSRERIRQLERQCLEKWRKSKLASGCLQKLMDDVNHG